MNYISIPEWEYKRDMEELRELKKGNKLSSLHIYYKDYDSGINYQLPFILFSSNDKELKEKINIELDNIRKDIDSTHVKIENLTKDFKNKWWFKLFTWL